MRKCCRRSFSGRSPRVTCHDTRTIQVVFVADTVALGHVFLRLLAVPCQYHSVSSPYSSIRLSPRRFVCHRRCISFAIDSVFTSHADKGDSRLLPLKMFCSVECPRPVVEVAGTVTQTGVLPFRDADSFVPVLHNTTRRHAGTWR